MEQRIYRITCKYCGEPLNDGLASVMVEESLGEGFFAHAICHQHTKPTQIDMITIIETLF